MNNAIVNYIKGSKVISFDSNRIKLLHWFYQVEPKTKQEGIDQGVPSYYYSKWCPLFHFTNLLAMGFVFIVLWRIMKWFGKGVWERFNEWLDYLEERRERKRKEWLESLSKEELRAMDIEYMERIARRCIKKPYPSSVMYGIISNKVPGGKLLFFEKYSVEWEEAVVEICKRRKSMLEQLETAKGVDNAIIGVCDFFSDLCKNHCPPVTIIDGSETVEVITERQ